VASGATNAAHANIIYAKIFNLKKILTGLIDAGLSEPESSLARPIVFGGQRGLAQDIRDDFQKVGLTHIMAVSGFNISILAAIVMIVLLALGLSRGRAFYLAIIILAAYIILVGAPASAMRAGLMGFLVLWALKLGRLNKMTNSLALTAAALLIVNPKLLRDDVGFQLSFLAIAGLVYAYPILEALWEKIKLPKLKGLSDALLITLAAQVFTLPIIAFNFSRISLIAPLANLAVLWALPILTVLILAALPLSFILPGLSFIFFLPCLILTKYILAVVRFFAGLPFSSMEIDYLPLGWVIFYYCLAIFLIIKLRSKLLKPDKIGKI
jgi:competence protein ComEC